MLLTSLYYNLWMELVSWFGQASSLKGGVEVAATMIIGLIGPLLIIYALSPNVVSRDARLSLRWLVYIASSLGLSGLVVTYLGIFGLSSQLGVILGQAILLVIAVLFRVVRRIRRIKDDTNRKRHNSIESVIVIVFVLLIGPFVLYHAASFPVLIWDALTYNAPIAKYLYSHGGFPSVVGVSLGTGMVTGYPPLHYAIGAYFYTFWGSDNDIFLRMLSPLSWLLLVWAGYELGRELGGSRLGAVAAVFLMFTPAIIFSGIVVNQYILLGLFSALMLVFVMRMEKNRSLQNCVWAGWFMGLAGLVTYNAYYLIAAIIVTAAMLRAREVGMKAFGRMTAFLKLFLLMLFLAGALNAPWWIHNIIVFGTPVPPFLTTNAVLEQYNPLRTAENISNIQGRLILTGNPRTWLDFFFWRDDLFPLASFLTLVGLFGLSVLGRSFLYVVVTIAIFWLSPFIQPAHHDRVVAAYSAALALSAALPLWFLIKRSKPVIFAAALLICGGVLMINIVNVLAYGSGYLLHSHRHFVSEEWAWDSMNKLPDKAYQQYWGYMYPNIEFVNNNLLPGKKVALVGVGAPPYLVAGGDLDRILFLDTLEALEVTNSGSSANLMRYLRDNNVQYVLGLFVEADDYWHSRSSLQAYINEALTLVYPEVWLVGD